VNTFKFYGSSPKTWIDLLIPAASILVSVVALVISLWIASRQRDVQERQLKKDLFDRRFEIYTKTRDFMSYVMRSDGKIVLTGEEYRDFANTMEKAEVLCPKVHPYLVDLDKTVRELYGYRQTETRDVAAGDVDRIQKGGDLMSRCIELMSQRNDPFRHYLALGE
jgi:hypothetical protein